MINLLNKYISREYFTLHYSFMCICLILPRIASMPLEEKIYYISFNNTEVENLLYQIFEKRLNNLLIDYDLNDNAECNADNAKTLINRIIIDISNISVCCSIKEERIPLKDYFLSFIRSNNIFKYTYGNIINDVKSFFKQKDIKLMILEKLIKEYKPHQIIYKHLTNTNNLFLELQGKKKPFLNTNQSHVSTLSNFINSNSVIKEIYLNDFLNKNIFRRILRRIKVRHIVTIIQKIQLYYFILIIM